MLQLVTSREFQQLTTTAALLLLNVSAQFHLGHMDQHTPILDNSLAKSSSFDLKWYEFYERRTVGHSLGLLLTGAGGIVLSLVSKPWTWFQTPEPTYIKSTSPLVWVSGGVSVAAIVLGLYLRKRKYFRDPIAMREYLESYHSSPFVKSFKSFGGWSGIRKVATQTMLESKIERELEGFIAGMNKMNVLTFDQIWQYYVESSGRSNLLSEMVDNNLLNIDYLKALALQELELESESGQSPDFPRWPSLSTGAANRNIVIRLKDYGIFLINKLAIPIANVHRAVQNDKELLDMDLAQLNRLGVQNLLTDDVELIPSTIIRKKALEYLAERKPTFQHFVAIFDKWLLDKHVLNASDVSYMFMKDIMALDPIKILDDWYDWPISQFGTSLGISTDQFNTLSTLRLQLQATRTTYAAAKRSAQAKLDAHKASAQVALDSTIAQLLSSSPNYHNNEAHVSSPESILNGEQLASYHAAKHKYDAQVLQAQSDFAVATAQAKRTKTNVYEDIRMEWKSVYFMGGPIIAAPSAPAIQINISI